MACDLTLGRKEPCKDVVGGLMAVYFFNFDDCAVTLTGDEVTDIDDGAATPGSATAYKYELKGANNLEEAINTSRDNGTTFFQQALNLTLKKLDADTTKEVKLLSYGRPKIVVQDRNGNAIMLGIEHGCDLVGGTIGTGTQQGDLAGYTLQFQGQEPIPGSFLNGATKADPFAGMSTSVTVVEGT